MCYSKLLDLKLVSAALQIRQGPELRAQRELKATFAFTRSISYENQKVHHNKIKAQILNNLSLPGTSTLLPFMVTWTH